MEPFFFMSRVWFVYFVQEHSSESGFTLVTDQHGGHNMQIRYNAATKDTEMKTAALLKKQQKIQNEKVLF